MAEMNDYSGPFKPDLKFDDFSREFLLKLIQVWQWSWIQLDAAFFSQILERSDLETAFECDTNMWLEVAERCNPRYAQIARIPNTNVIDCHKVYQLPLDNSMGTIYANEYDIRDEYHSIFTVVKCPSLEWCEKNDPARIVPMCHVLERQVIDKYKVNMDVKLTPLKLAPRNSPDEPACQWELKLDVPEGTPRRPLEELVDWTTDPPEVDDLSGPFYPHLTHKNFSKPFLLKMMDAWQYAWLTMAEAYYNLAREKFGFEAANEINEAVWTRIARRVNPRYPAMANIELNTVVDSLKCLQLPLDNNIGPLYGVMFDIKNENHVVMTMTKCRSLDYYEKNAPEFIEAICHGFEKKGIENYLLNPRIEVTPLKLPPRKSPDDIPCQWELKIN